MGSRGTECTCVRVLSLANSDLLIILNECLALVYKRGMESFTINNFHEVSEFAVFEFLSKIKAWLSAGDSKEFELRGVPQVCAKHLFNRIKKELKDINDGECTLVEGYGITYNLVIYTTNSGSTLRVLYLWNDVNVVSWQIHKES